VTVSVKPGVRFERDALALSRILSTLLLLPDVGPVRSLVITSGTDGSHMPNSKHYRGEAVDIRTRDWTPAVREQVRAALERELGPKFGVLDEGDHLHVQVKKGQVYP
jgi:hypothetical protein